jgi:PAS domain S-box-containing protein
MNVARDVMSQEFRLLILEDRVTDAELCQEELRRAGLHFTARRVETRAGFEAALGEFRPDLILADFVLPGAFDGLVALELAQAALPRVPFVFVSGTIGEERAVEAIKLGASDCVLKDRLGRLGPAVLRALEGAQLRKEMELAETALLASEIKYHELIEQAADGIFVTDHAGKLLLANPRLCEMTGYSNEELVGRSIAETYPEEERAGLPGRFAQLAEVRTRLFERMLRRKDGSCFPVEVSVKFLANGTHQGIVRDITERRRAAEALRESEARFAAIITSAMDGMISINERHEVILFNPAAERMFGHAASEVLGRPLDMLLPERLRAAHNQHIADFGDTGVTSRAMGSLGHIVGLRSNGEEFPIEASISQTGSGAGKLYTVILRDITERKRAEDGLRELTRRLMALQETERRGLARELHDRLGQNLSALGLNLGLLHEASMGDRTALKRIADSLRLLEEAGMTISNVLTELKPPMLASRGLLEALRWNAHEFSRRTGVALEVDGAEAAPRLPPEIEMALFRIAQSALANVARHAHAQQVRITLERSGNGFRFEIADDGAGFDVERALASGRWGLEAMRERADAIGAALRIDSAAGRGARIVVEAVSA